VAFLAVGLFVVYGLFDGVATVCARASRARAGQLLRLEQGGRFAWTQWFALTLLSMLSVVFLPRQFQVMVVENVDEEPPAPRRLGVSAVPAGHQPVCAAHCPGRAAVFWPRQHECRELRAVAAAGGRTARAGAVCLHRRAVGGHRHGDRGDHRGVHHGLQRPGDAAAAAHAHFSPERRA
jgi:hypothetical protein